MRVIAARIGSLAVFGALAGCILFVPSPEGGEHCSFAGQATECGVCMRDRCQAQIDACCGDSACQFALEALDGCASTRDGRCVTLRSASRQTGAAGALGECTAARCSGACARVEGTSKVACREPPLAAEAACRCTSDGSTNSFTCSPATYPDTVCCAPPGWPSPGQECTCLPIGCTSTTIGCSCGRVDFEKPQSRSCETGTCCVSPAGCACRGDAPCHSWETPVFACNAQTALCPQGTSRVESCSIFE